MHDISTLIENLKDITWKWSEVAIEPILASIGGELVEAVPARRTYAMRGGLTLSVYAEYGTVEFLESTVDAFLDPQRLSPGEYENKVDEYFGKYEQTVALAARILGPPIFNDRDGSDGFPDDQDAVWLAQWNLPSARLMIQQKHEDKELPFRLCVVVTPPVDAS
jgi:hypothetical protein